MALEGFEARAQQATGMLRRILPTSITVIVLAAFCSRGMGGAAPVGPGESGVNAGSVSASDAGAPIYPGGKPINGGLQKITLYSRAIGTNVTFTTTDSFEKVYKFYKHALPPQTVAEETDHDPKIGTFKYTKGDGSQIDIEIRSYPGHTNYTITDTYKK
jgi:hypothetical protein